MRITSKGQVAIPFKIRERAGLLPNTDVEFEFDGRSVRIVKARASKKSGRGDLLVARPRGSGDIAMTEIMAPTRAVSRNHLIIHCEFCNLVAKRGCRGSVVAA